MALRGEKNVPYISIVGFLMYLAVTTRPDIAYAAGVLARFNSNPGPSHWQAASMFCAISRAQQTTRSPISPLIHLSHSSLIQMRIMEGRNPDNGKCRECDLNAEVSLAVWAVCTGNCVGCRSAGANGVRRLCCRSTLGEECPKKENGLTRMSDWLA